MALKTMYRQLISKYGVMSIEMQMAYANDMTVQPDITQKDSDEDTAPVEFFDAQVVDADTGEVAE